MKIANFIIRLIVAVIITAILLVILVMVGAGMIVSLGYISEWIIKIAKSDVLLYLLIGGMTAILLWVVFLGLPDEMIKRKK